MTHLQRPLQRHPKAKAKETDVKIEDATQENKSKEGKRKRSEHCDCGCTEAKKGKGKEHAYVGRKVSKAFENHGSYNGEVLFFCDTRQKFLIQYSDNDTEHLTELQVRKILMQSLLSAVASIARFGSRGLCRHCRPSGQYGGVGGGGRAAAVTTNQEMHW